jgi:hypothetical protein
MLDEKPSGHRFTKFNEYISPELTDQIFFFHLQLKTSNLDISVR